MVVPQREERREQEKEKGCKTAIQTARWFEVDSAYSKASSYWSPLRGSQRPIGSRTPNSRIHWRLASQRISRR